MYANDARLFINGQCDNAYEKILADQSRNGPLFGSLN